MEPGSRQPPTGKRGRGKHILEDPAGRMRKSSPVTSTGFPVYEHLRRQPGGVGYARRLKRPKTEDSPPANRSFLPLAAIPRRYPTNSDAVTWNGRLACARDGWFESISLQRRVTQNRSSRPGVRPRFLWWGPGRLQLRAYRRCGATAAVLECPLGDTLALGDWGYCNDWWGSIRRL